MQVLISCRGEASGKVNISLPYSFVTNNSLVLETNNHYDIPFEYLKYFALNYNYKNHVSGSAQPQITIEGIYDADFIMPKESVLSNFEKIISPIEEKRLNNHNEIQTLTQIRDTLLPKLMSGEVRVKNV